MHRYTYVTVSLGCVWCKWVCECVCLRLCSMCARTRRIVLFLPVPGIIAFVSVSSKRRFIDDVDSMAKTDVTHCHRHSHQPSHTFSINFADNFKVFAASKRSCIEYRGDRCFSYFARQLAGWRVSTKLRNDFSLVLCSMPISVQTANS